jgi:transmembrane sensor
MDFTNHTAKDFLEIASFREWVLSPTDEQNTYWQTVETQNPELVKEILLARNFLETVSLEQKQHLSTQDNENVVFEKIKAEMPDTEQIVRPIYGYFNALRWVAAAVVVFCVGVWAYRYFAPEKSHLSYQDNVAVVNNEKLIEKVNTSQQTILLNLEDGSSIFLKPNSKISYAKNFGNSDKREVYMSGEVFFEVAKNPNKPFYVFANEMVTKVLGTSFNIRAFPDEEDVIVKVRTGRVSVAINNNLRDNEKISSREIEGIVLTPNQQAVLARQEIRLVKSIIENPEIQNDNNLNIKQIQNFVFVEAKASDVLKAIEKAYNIEVVFDENTLAQCEFTGNISDESLYEKLNILCKTIEAEYQILDAQIIIQSKGCR